MTNCNVDASTHFPVPPMPVSWRCLVVMSVLLLHGCQSAVLPPVVEVAEPQVLWVADTSRFGARPAIVDDIALHALSPEQQQQFLMWFEHPLRATLTPQRRLFYYLEELGDNFSYDDRTLTASDTLRLRTGNCLSLAILTTALARLVGIEVGYQLMNDEPVFQLGGDVVKKGLHVRTVLNLPSTNPSGEVLRPSRIIIDYFPTGSERFVANLDAGGYLALYHGNLAAEALQRGALSTAYWQSLAALQLAPQDAAALNLLAVVHRRAGDTTTAEAIYRHAIAQADDKLSLLKNYQLLLQQSGRLAEAEAIGRQLEAMDDPSPYRWYLLARMAERDGDTDGAIRYYGRALARAPYLHEAHLGQALAYCRSGQLDRASSSMRRALGAARTVSERKLYSAKLAALGRD